MKQRRSWGLVTSCERQRSASKHSVELLPRCERLMLYRLGNVPRKTLWLGDRATKNARCFPADCHVKRKSRFPRNDIKFCVFTNTSIASQYYFVLQMCKIFAYVYGFCKPSYLYRDVNTTIISLLPLCNKVPWPWGAGGRGSGSCKPTLYCKQVGGTYLEVVELFIQIKIR